MSGTFRREDDDHERGFTYTDTDGDKIILWRYGPGGGLRINDTGAEGVSIDPADLDRFQAEVDRLRTLPCSACQGKGTIRS